MATITKNDSTQVFGTAGNDVINVFGNNALTTSIYGGLGNDFYLIDVAQTARSGATTADDIIIEDINGGIDTVQVKLAQFSDAGAFVGSDEYTLGANVENLEAKLTNTTIAPRIFSINGNDLANVITVLTTDASSIAFISGLAGNDKLISNSNNDSLDGGTGNDTMIGGLGNDTYFVDSTADIIQELPDSGVDEVISKVSYTLAANIENLSMNARSENINATGNALNNEINGSTGNNILSGLDGDDQLRAASGNDTLLGGNGVDMLLGDDGNDSLDGGAGDDNLQGGSGNDNLLGGLGNDVLNGEQGADKLNGGTGDDTYVDVQAADVVTDTGVGGNDTVFAIEQLVGDLGVGIENLVLGSGIINGRGNALANFISGNTSGNLIFGLAGNDILNGEAGDDVLDGGEGNDVLDGGLGNDLMRGGNGNDIYIFNAANDAAIETSLTGGIDTVFSSVNISVLNEFVENLTLASIANLSANGNARDNTINGNAGDNVLAGNAGNDKLFGFAGIDVLQGGDGKDTLDGGIGADNLEGGSGDDVYFVDDAGDTVTEYNSQGIDMVMASTSFILSDDIENLTLLGTENTFGTGQAGNNLILGNIGNNGLSGGLGIDTLKGGKGNDNYTVTDSADVLIELANEGTDTVNSSADFTLGANFERLTLTDAATKGTGNALDNTIFGNSNNNSLTGGDGNDSLNGALGADTLLGGNGNDTLDGGAGNDSMVGGTGNDIYVIDSASDIVIELAGGGIDTVRKLTGGFIDLRVGSLANVENFVDISDSGNTVIGNDLNNNLLGEDFADDDLSGGIGNDTLAGGSGNNILTGGLGDDTYIVGFGTDSITELDGQGKDTVLSYGSIDFSVGALANAFIENITLTSEYSANAKGNAANNIITGNDEDNQLFGLAGNDTLIGNAGDDVLFGGLGNDLMSGGLGNDTYEVDSLGDKVTELANGGLDRVYSSVAFTLGANLEELALLGSASVNATGNALNNLIVGNDGSNSINGGAGNDTLSGGTGTASDTLTGGLGEDQFTFNAVGLEKVTDYTIGVDSLALFITNAQVTFTGAGGTLTASQFSNVGGTSVVLQGLDADNTIIYQQATGNLYYDEDGSATGFSAVLIADFKDGLALAATDFFNFQT